MPSPSTISKGLRLLTHPYFFTALIRHRVAAASEHVEAIKFCAANTLIDAGANKGQFSLAFRKYRPRARIIAFEPLPEAADTYQNVFGREQLTQLFRVALADTEGSAEFYVADRADSSSLLRPGQGQARAFDVRPAGTISVSVKRLDDCVDIHALERPILLKVDVQGGEVGVFDGCRSLDLVDFIYVELSYVELYERQPLFPEVCNYLQKRGFAVRGLFNQVATTEFGPTQIDVLFQRAHARDGRSTQS